MPGPGADLVGELARRFLLALGVAALAMSAVVMAADGTSRGSLMLAPRLGAIGAMAAAVVGLAVQRYEPRLAVRALEVLLFGGLLTFLFARVAEGLVGLSTLGHPALVTGAWSEGLLHLVLVMGAYALVVPNCWWRAAVMLTFMAASAPTTAAVAAALDPALAQTLAPVLQGSALTTTVIALGLTVLVGTAGAALTGVFRDLALDAREQRLYTLERKLGAGAMGEVWLAEHGTLKRPAAIKVIRPERLDGDPAEARRMVKRFEAEAQATARLRSPNTVEVYDFGVTSKGLFFYVMEFLDGIDLQTLVTRFGPLPAERAAYLARQACESLADAHDHDLVHRDVKPANLHVGRFGLAHDVVKVLDFGLARRQGEREGATHLSAEGHSAGTPAYMAPEVARGECAADARADIYGVGCVLFWLLTGRLVFEGKNAVDVMIKHATEPPPRPSELTELPIPDALEACVLRCLDKDPDQRWPSMEALADALGAVPFERPWTAARARDWWRTHVPRG